MSAEQRRGLVGGFIFAALGIMFLLEALEVYELAPSTTWPILLVALGVGILSGVGGEDGDDGDDGTIT